MPKPPSLAAAQPGVSTAAARKPKPVQYATHDQRLLTMQLYEALSTQKESIAVELSTKEFPTCLELKLYDGTFTVNVNDLASGFLDHQEKLKKENHPLFEPFKAALDRLKTCRTELNGRLATPPDLQSSEYATEIRNTTRTLTESILHTYKVYSWTRLHDTSKVKLLAQACHQEPVQDAEPGPGAAAAPTAEPSDTVKWYITGKTNNTLEIEFYDGELTGSIEVKDFLACIKNPTLYEGVDMKAKALELNEIEQPSPKLIKELKSTKLKTTTINAIKSCIETTLTVLADILPKITTVSPADLTEVTIAHEAQGRKKADALKTPRMHTAKLFDPRRAAQLEETRQREKEQAAQLGLGSLPTSPTSPASPRSEIKEKPFVPNFASYGRARYGSTVDEEPALSPGQERDNHDEPREVTRFEEMLKGMGENPNDPIFQGAETDAEKPVEQTLDEVLAMLDSLVSTTEKPG